MRIWIFADFRLPSTKRLEMFKNIGITDVVLGISSDTKKFKLNSHPDKIWRTVEKILELGMKVHFMAWAIRNEKFIEDVKENMNWTSVTRMVNSYILNVEGTWYRGRSLSSERAAELLEVRGMPLGVVGFDKLHKTVRPLAETCDFVIPEAYSFWNSKSGHWSHTWKTFPGVQQRRAFDSWKVVNKPMVMGLACYMGKRPRSTYFPGLTDIQAMRYSIAETMSIIRENKDLCDFRGVGAYWSGKHLDGTPKIKQDRREFITNLSNQSTMLFP
jgi:hypothetical protein